MASQPDISLPMSEEGTPHKSPRQGATSGGRWLFWAGRILLWSVLVVVFVNGLLRIAGVGVSAAPTTQEATPETDFPTLEASAYAAQFAGVYLDTDEEEDRLEMLAEYLGESRARAVLPPAQAWQVSDMYVSGIDPTDEHNAVVSLHLRLNGVPMSMDVPVYTDEDGMAITGAPALLPAEAGTSRPGAPRIEHDDETAEDITPVLDGFFDSYATSESDHLSRYVEPDQDLPSLPLGMVELAQVREVLVPYGEDDQPRQVQATVVWNVLPPAPEEETEEDEDEEDVVPGQITQVYALTMVREGSSWYVRHVSGTPTATK